MHLYIVEVFGLYGGQWYCAVYADSDEEANKKAKDYHQINNENYKKFEQINLNSTVFVETELIFEDGISNLWFVSW